jgi:hypothetical protein
MLKQVSVIALAVSASLSMAGTYSIVGGSVNATTTPGAFASTPDPSAYWQVTYGASNSHEFDYHAFPDIGITSSSSNPIYNWTVRWTASYTGEVPPTGQVPVKAKAIGHAYAYAFVDTYRAPGNAGTFNATVTSIGTPIVSAALSQGVPLVAQPNGNTYTAGTLTNQPLNDLLLETGYFVQVSPGIYEAQVQLPLSASVMLSWTNNPFPVTLTVINLSGEVWVRIRPTEIDGQQVAPPL